MKVEDLGLRFADLKQDGYQFDCQIIPGEIDVLQIAVEGFEEIPSYLSITDSQIICITYLWEEDEVSPDKRNELMELLLDMNIPMPLSAFSRIDDKYVIFGSLSVNSAFEDIVHEVITLSENAVEALDLVSDYLK